MPSALVPIRANGTKVNHKKDSTSSLISTYFQFPNGKIALLPWRKPVGYLEQHNDQILLASGNGTFFSIEKNKIAEFIPKDNEDLLV